jgi:hypothetical protein
MEEKNRRLCLEHSSLLVAMLEALYTKSISVFPITMKEEKENMLKELRLDNSAPWKQRFHAPGIFWTMIATEEPTRGLVASNRSGIAQLYFWLAFQSCRQSPHVSGCNV